MKIRPLGLLCLFVALTPVYGKHEKMPLPQQVITAKTIFIDNRSGFASLGDRAYDELKKWGRYQIVDSADKADMVFLLSAKEYVSGYTSSTYGNTNGTVDNNGNINAHTYGSSNSAAVYSGTTYVTLIDPKTGNALWSDARAWGRFKSATRGLVKELRDRIKDQEEKK
jgi:hypothetical protein